MLLHKPLGVAAVLEGDQRKSGLFDDLEGLDPQPLLLHHSDEALGGAIALGLGDTLA